MSRAASRLSDATSASQFAHARDEDVVLFVNVPVNVCLERREPVEHRAVGVARIGRRRVALRERAQGAERRSDGVVVAQHPRRSAR